MGLYYSNTWRCQDFPFPSHISFASGIPWLTGTYIGYSITKNMGKTATFVHIFLLNCDDVKLRLVLFSRDNLTKIFAPVELKFWKGGKSEQREFEVLSDENIDPNYKLMAGCDEAPQLWYGMALLTSFIVGLGTLYGVGCILFWWGFIVANLLSAIMIIFLEAQIAITGFRFKPVIISRCLPVTSILANLLSRSHSVPIRLLYPSSPSQQTCTSPSSASTRSNKASCSCATSNSPACPAIPKTTFTAQMPSYIVGAIFNYIMMISIVISQREIVTSVADSNIGLGQNVQQYNTLAVDWSIAGDLFSVDTRYQRVTFALLVRIVVPFPFWIIPLHQDSLLRIHQLSVIHWYMGYLSVGINAAGACYLDFGVIAQLWPRKYHPHLLYQLQSPNVSRFGQWNQGGYVYYEFRAFWWKRQTSAVSNLGWE